jgi:signal transduction histidine kinase
MNPADWLRRLHHVAWQQNSLRGLNAVLEVIGKAAGMTRVVLWDGVWDGDGTVDRQTRPWLSPVAQWSATGIAAGSAPPRPDATTIAAFCTGSLALPPVGAGPSARRVVGALPLTRLDGGRSVLSLTGHSELTGAAFDLAADLADTLPGICAALRDRQTLSLLGECQQLLHEADLASPRDPLNPVRLKEYAVRLCRSIAAIIDCAEVAIYLTEDVANSDAAPLYANTAEPLADGAEPRPQARGASVITSPLVSGQSVWGQLRCIGPRQPPFQFTRMDEESLRAVVVQLSQYWSNWLHRRKISAEISSWNRLATGINAFNQRVSEGVSHGGPRAGTIDDIALKVVLDVVPECGRVDVWDVVAGQRPGSAVTFAHRAARGPVGNVDGEHAVVPTSVRALLDAVYRTGAAQTGTIDPGMTVADGALPRPTRFIGAPIGFGGSSDGVLSAFGPTHCIPPTAKEVCEIIGDQLALYRTFDQTMAKLRQTMTALKDTGDALKATVRAQADTLADLKHQLVSPVLVATSRIDELIKGTRLDGRTDAWLRAVRGLCRRAYRVAMSAGVFADLSQDRSPTPKDDLLSANELLRILIAGADDAQVLSNPGQRITFEVERDSVRALGRRLIRADRSFLEQSLGNLLDNAAKYSYEDTRVDIEGHLDDGHFTISVTNYGLPIAPEDVPRCLERNWRGRAASTATGEGSGLGLWIVDNLIRSMRGRVDIHAVGDRTTVTLAFPLG